MRVRQLDLPLLLLFGCAFPQGIYIYAYANSDAWGISWGIFLLAFALRLHDKGAVHWRWGDGLLAGGMTGILLAAKANYVASLVLPYALLVSALVQARRRQAPGRRQALRVAAALLAGIVVVAAPYKLVYPMTQGDFQAKIVEMRQARATEGFKPGDPKYFLYKMHAKGYGYADILFKTPFVGMLLYSFYGVFGWMNRYLSIAAYLGVYAVMLTMMALNAGYAFRRWKQLPGALRTVLPLSPVVFAGLCLGVLHLSLHVDFQPQGRYLYAALPAVTLLLGGSARWQPARARGLTGIAALALSVVSLGILWQAVILGDLPGYMLDTLIPY